MDNWTLKVICAYGPIEGAKREDVEHFYETLESTADCKGNERLIIIGHLDARVGNETEIYGNIIGRFGEKGKPNNNGKALLDFCGAHGFCITNTFFQHKANHKYTWREEKRNKKSIIDYIIVDKELKSLVQDSRVYRGFEIGSDHHFVLSKLKMKMQTRRDTYKKVLKRIKIEKLHELPTSIKYKESIIEKAAKVSTRDRNVEEEWQEFKRAIVGSAKEVCGEVICKDRKYRTPWWTEEVKEAVKEKKLYYRRYLANKTEKALLEYRQKCKKTKIAVKLAKEKSWEDFGKDIEKNYQEGSNKFWKIIKKLRNGGKTFSKGMKDESGELKTEHEEILGIWSNYFDNLLNEGSRNDLNNTIENKIEMEPPGISVIEVDKAIKNLKCGKAAGVDEIRPEMLKAGGTITVQWLHRIIQKAWEEGKIPEDWNKAIIVPIYKKGNRMECSNYRGISLLSVPGKVYASIIEKRIRNLTEGKLGENQAGFRPNRGCQDQIFALRQIIEKSWEYNKDLYLGFVDLEKAYDKVPRHTMFRTLQLYGINGYLLRAVQSIYNNPKSAVRVEGSTGRWFEVKLGVRQGCTLSPLLIIIYMDHLLKNCKLTSDVKIGSVNVTSLLYADDVVLINSCPNRLQTSLTNQAR